MAGKAPRSAFKATRKPKKPKGKKTGGGKKSNAWRAYVGVSNAPLPW
jgi:hypothetical protein